MGHGREHGVAGVLGPGASAVVAVGHALNAVPLRREHVAGGGVKGDDHRLLAGLQPGSVLPVHHGGAGEDRSILVRGQGRRQFRPVDQVFADRVAPVDVAIIQAGAGGIVLGEEVVLPLVIKQAVDVAHPSLLVGEVKLRAIGLVVKPARGKRGAWGLRLFLGRQVVSRVVCHPACRVGCFRCSRRHQALRGLRGGRVGQELIREQPDLASCRRVPCRDRRGCSSPAPGHGGR